MCNSYNYAAQRKIEFAQAQVTSPHHPGGPAATRLEASEHLGSHYLAGGGASNCGPGSCGAQSSMFNLLTAQAFTKFAITMS